MDQVGSKKVRQTKIGDNNNFVGPWDKDKLCKKNYLPLFFSF